MGVPFYGRDAGWNNAQAYSWIVDNFDPSPGDDWAGPYFFNGIDTIRAKTAYVYDNDYAGVMIRNLSHDKSCHRSLRLAIVEEAALDQAPGPAETTPNLKVAFIGDQGLSSNAQAVLQLIQAEGAAIVFHQGDLG